MEGLGPRVPVIAGLAATGLQMPPPPRQQPGGQHKCFTAVPLVACPRETGDRGRKLGDTEGHTWIAGVGVGQARTDAQQTQVAGQVRMAMNPGALRQREKLPYLQGLEWGFPGKGLWGGGLAAWKGQVSGSLPPSWVLVCEQSQSF